MKARGFTSRFIVSALLMGAALFLPSAARAAYVEVENDTSYNIIAVYFSPSGSPRWGYNRLTLADPADQNIAPGQYEWFEFTGGDYCVWDFKIFTAQYTAERRNANLCEHDRPVWHVHNGDLYDRSAESNRESI
jgi:hypothetical protein